MVIIAQSLLIVFGALWFASYKHIVEQTHLVSGLGFVANETRFMTRVERRISAGQCDVAQKILSDTASSNVEKMKDLVQKLDMDVPKQLGTARDYSKILQDVGIHEISALIEQRAAQEDIASSGGA